MILDRLVFDKGIGKFLYWLTRGHVVCYGWGIQLLHLKRRGYLTWTWRSASVRGWHVYWSPNATPWHHGAKTYWPLRRFGQRTEKNGCVCCEECKALRNSIQ